MKQDLYYFNIVQILNLKFQIQNVSKYIPAAATALAAFQRFNS